MNKQTRSEYSTVHIFILFVLTKCFFSFSYINDVCGKNYLAVGSKKRENLCGKSTPHVFISEENDMWITYYQNTSVAKVGFEAKYTRGKIRMWYSISCRYQGYRTIYKNIVLLYAYMSSVILSFFKLGWEDLWEIPFQNCVWQICTLFKMATGAKNRNFFNFLLLFYYKSKWVQILTAATWQRLV